MSKKWHNKHQDQKEPNNHQKPACHEDKKWPLIYPVKIEPSAEDNRKYGDTQNFRRSQIRLSWGLNIVTACAACIGLAGLAFLNGQVGVMKGQLDVMRREQRAWVRMTFDSSPLHALSPVVGTMHILNTGKTPGRQIEGMMFVQTLGINETPELKLQGPFTRFSTGIVFPNDKPDKLFDGIIKRQRRVPTMDLTPIGTLPPIDSPFSELEIDQFAKGEIFLIVYGRITYTDTSGEHWTQYCSPLTSGAGPAYVHTKNCIDFNNADNN